MASRWLWRGLLAAVLCGALAAGVLLLWVDPNDFKPQIVAAVRGNTGRELTIEGDLGLKLFPYLAVSVGSLQLGNGAGFEGPFLTLRKAHLKARLLPLLLSRLEVVAVDVEGLSLFLARDADGRGNWMDLSDPAVPDGNEKEGSVLRRDRRVPLLASLIVDGLKVSDARVVWDDRLKNDRFEVSGIHLDVSDFAFGEPFEVDTSAAAKVGALDGELVFSTRAILDLDRLVVENLKLQAVLRGEGLPQGPETVTLTADLVSTEGRLDNGRMQGLGLDARFASREAPGADSAGAVSVAPFNPRDVFKRLNLPLPSFTDPTVLEQAAFACGWTAGKGRLDVSDLRLTVDNSTMQGSMAVIGFDDPFVSLDLRVDALNADRYTIRSADGDGKDAGRTGDGGLPVKELRALNGNATLAVGELTAAKVRCSDALVRGRAAGGLVVLEDLATKAYGGRLQASGSLDVRSGDPVWTWRHSMSGLQLGSLLSDMHGRAFITGTTWSEASVETRGTETALLKRNLRGTYDFKVEKGTLNGVNIPKRVRDGIRALKGQAVGPDEPERTEFSVLSGRGTIVRGVDSSRDLLMLAPRFRITGGGQADLVREDMDYRLTLHLHGSEGAFDEGALGLSSFPVRVSGPIRQPTVTPDMTAVLRGLGLSGGRAIGDTLKGVGESLKQLFQ